MVSAPMVSVHPHGRGEHAARLTEEGAKAGPSPRAWGTLTRSEVIYYGTRSIPTGVGNTTASSRSNRRPPGPSPRAWGTRLRRQHRRPRYRSIPTGVGNTPPPPGGLPRGPRSRSIPTGVGNTSQGKLDQEPMPVHPHGRGEHTVNRRLAALRSGPSPRAWGTRFRGYFRVLAHRSIPTGVGNTQASSTEMPGNAVHPHGRGEHATRPRHRASDLGPSPRAWGTPNGRYARRFGYRSIPTGVGNTQHTRKKLTRAAVHPHGRGEHQKTIRRAWEAVGPSPRAWGTRPPLGLVSARLRSIPTGVGNTSDHTSQPTGLSVHPHGRGEHASGIGSHSIAYGPSPRAWGTLDYARTHRGHGRSIPTGVGNTPTWSH